MFSDGQTEVRARTAIRLYRDQQEEKEAGIR